MRWPGVARGEGGRGGALAVCYQRVKCVIRQPGDLAVVREKWDKEVEALLGRLGLRPPLTQKRRWPCASFTKAGRVRMRRSFSCGWRGVGGLVARPPLYPCRVRGVTRVELPYCKDKKAYDSDSVTRRE